MQNLKELPMIQVVDIFLNNSQEPQTLEEIIKYVASQKEFDPDDIDIINQLYLDMTCSGKYVYVGENKWDLKERNLEFWDKEGISFISEEERNNLEDSDDMDLDFTKFDLDNFNNKLSNMTDDIDEDYEDDETSEEEKLIQSEEAEYLDVELPTDEEYEDFEDITFNYDDDHNFEEDEDKYNDIMDEFEDLYD